MFVPFSDAALAIGERFSGIHIDVDVLWFDTSLSSTCLLEIPFACPWLWLIVVR